MAKILLDENIGGYRELILRHVYGADWAEISVGLEIAVFNLADVGLELGSTDEFVWERCQELQLYLLTDNRNDHAPDSPESVIRDRCTVTSLPVFTLSDLRKFRNEMDYRELVVAKLLDFLIQPASLLGTGRLYLP